MRRHDPRRRYHAGRTSAANFSADSVFRTSRFRRPPRLAIVTTSLDLDLDTPLFTEAERRPLVLTSERSSPSARTAIATAADVVVAGEDAVDLRRAVAVLTDLGAGVVLAEGGPRLNGGLVAAGVVDEWNLTVSPVLAAGEGGPAAVASPPVPPVPLRLDRVLEGDGLLFLRHVREDVQ